MKKITTRPALTMLGLFIVVYSISANPRPANATNNAFSNTKHGGGTTDSIVPYNNGNGPGVDRSVNPNYTGYYDSASSEAGKYKGSECMHCHEPHSSFGGTEPYPNASPADDGGGPNPYLGMADTKPEFCWYCHENMLLNSNPQGYGYWGFFQGAGIYKASGHYNNTNMKNPGYGSGSPWPRTNRSSLQSGHCLHCHTPHGIMEPSSSPYDTTAVPSSKHLAANNPNVSKDYLLPRQLIAWEEALCENCHKSTGEGGIADAKDIKGQLDKLQGTGSGHPVHNVNQSGSSSGTTFSGRHTLKNEFNPTAGNWNAYGNNTRHVECYDCHNPHAARKGSNGGTIFRRSGDGTTGRDVTIGPTQVLTPDGFGGANVSVWGVNVDISTGNITGRAAEITYLYQLCLKCHSAYADISLTTQQGYSGPLAPSWINRTRWDGQMYTELSGDDPRYLTDVAKDFATGTPSGNPQKGYHPVFTIGRNRPPINANPRWGALTYNSRTTGTINISWGFRNNFVPPWGPDAYVTCVDCHEDSSDTTPRGPHGSDRPFILRKLDRDITYTLASGETVRYSNFNYGRTSSNGYGPYGPVDLSNADPNDLCLNCHRADVYGFFGQNIGGASCPKSDRIQDNTVFPRYRWLSRQPHPVEGGFMENDDTSSQGVNGHGYSFATNCEHSSAGWAPRGIVCLRCHGGGSVGGIHGNLGNIYGHTNNNNDPSSDSAPFEYSSNNGWYPSSNRLLNGTAWKGLRFGRTDSMGGCYKANEQTPFNYNACTHSGGPTEFDNMAMYNY